jgi:hypothetical protein
MLQKKFFQEVKKGDFLISEEEFESLTGKKPEKMLRLTDIMTGDNSSAEFEFYNFNRDKSRFEVHGEDTGIEFSCAENVSLEVKKQWENCGESIRFHLILSWE